MSTPYSRHSSRVLCVRAADGIASATPSERDAARHIARLPWSNRVVRERQSFLSYAIDQSLALPVSAVIALLWANLAPATYTQLTHALEFPVNDIAMVFFFGLAAKEVVEATAP